MAIELVSSIHSKCTRTYLVFLRLNNDPQREFLSLIEELKFSYTCLKCYGLDVSFDNATFTCNYCGTALVFDFTSRSDQYF